MLLFSAIFDNTVFIVLRRSGNISLQTSVVEQTSRHTLEVFESTLPVQVTEAIALAERMYLNHSSDT